MDYNIIFFLRKTIVCYDNEFIGKFLSHVITKIISVSKNNLLKIKTIYTAAW